MANQATFTVPFQVSGQSLTRPGPTVWNTPAVMPATAFYLWDASKILIPQATSVTGAITLAITHNNLKSFELPNVTNITAAITLTNAPALEVFSIPSLTALSANINLNGGALTVDSVNAFYLQLDAITPALSGLTFNTAGGSNAAPTGAGLAAAVNLDVLNTVTKN